MEKKSDSEKKEASLNTKIKLKYITIFLIVVCLCALLYYLRNVLAPFVGAFLIAYIVNPVVDKIEEWTRFLLRHPKLRSIPKRSARIVATIATLCLMAAVVTIFCLIFIPQICEEFSRFGSLVKKFMSDSVWIQQVLALFPSDWRNSMHNFR